ncbi:YdeI/OmpD-associated family protein [Fulvimonas sp. R45]|uniref:YdeI/OmpD-associated family protein n=1 Tax=Fulvimonas sp. R45 TaxID=3045937 RepID=UPI00265EEA8D|nr:YdeI/OmpD-associated family protein [Fulvimonas sp. R45]MDO1527879.1 YdeI/OmpD-associated family protein [Fulvimonas sp. R45]
MAGKNTPFRFETKLLRPAKPRDASWTFVVLPAEASARLPRRGRTTVEGTLNGRAFAATLEPDGRLSHWLKVDGALREAAGVAAGDMVVLEIMPAREPEPALPPDLRRALSDAPESRAAWEGTTTLARVDWIHWIVSARQPATRARRIADACDMLASGKRRVCCFDPSGYYSKAFSAPEAADEP